ncbi:unnamed protein product [Lymnaea stagnalis]|uniref:Glycoprotein-N-acetylgalactosamine 3-beta-galactosyltransferase 1 n=1 Tax=Lymnaea stagnalis TaxID=6523 RepID=A0AAV2HYI4_LYMST
MPSVVNGFGKVSVITLAIGIFIGISVSNIFRFTTSPRNSLSGYIPVDPHSHGENDDVSGPDNSLSWHDEHSHSHANENNSVARYLYKKVRVLCWVMTNPNNIQTKARHVKATWGKRCNILLFMSSKSDWELPAVALNVAEGRDHLWAKTKAAFKYIYSQHLNDADWFVKSDDDTYIVVENLRYFLQNKLPSEPVFYGRRFKPMVKQGYMSGGAGYVLSKEALSRVVTQGLDNPEKCRSDNGGAEDLEMGKCLENVGVLAGDTRDELGRERFHPFIPEHHLIPDILPKEMWYWSYNFYPAKQGQECCSDYSITFHYITPNMMYVLEYLIYHLKPYGINTVIHQELSSPAANLDKPNSENNNPVLVQQQDDSIVNDIIKKSDDRELNTYSLEKVKEQSENDLENMVDNGEG